MSGAAPPDRAWVLTVQRNPRTVRLGHAGVAACVAMLNAEDALVAPAVARAGAQITAFIEGALPGFARGGRLIYVGAGTSGRLGVLDASECPPTFQTPPERVVGVIAGGESALRRSSEGAEDDPAGAHAALDALGLTKHDSLLGIAAGGTTPYVLGAVEHAAAAGALTGVLTCSPIDRPRGARHVIVVETGAEALTGSTRMKAGTATKMVLNIISTTLMAQTGKIHENLMVDLRATNAKLRDRAARIVAALTGVSRERAFGVLDDAGGAV